ncbi:MAG: transglutaminase-like cysteine peptidase [Methylacidiphilales bacterium]|nr:transglutaminase-like cysteine peptidase [Candidatus Methylacidiphilales bacterium]
MLMIGVVMSTAKDPAGAMPLSATRLGNPMPKSTPMPRGQTVLAPIAAIRFCMDYKDECRASEDSATKVALSEERWADLDEVNRSVNAAIRPRADEGLDIWNLDVAAGDCDDYAVLKRHRLIARGWPRGAVGLAIARIPSTEYHLVTVVTTDMGDYVLDSLHDRVLPWSRVGYRWVMRSSAGDPRLWHAIAGPGRARMARRAVPVAFQRSASTEKAPSSHDGDGATLAQ